MKLVIDLPPEDFAAAKGGHAIDIQAPVTAILVREEGTKESFTRPARYVEAVGRTVADQQGVAAGGPVIHVWLKESS